MNLKPFIFLFVLLNVLILHIYLFYNFSVPYSNTEIKKGSNFIATLTIIHDESEKVDKKVTVKKEKIVKVDKTVTVKKKKVVLVKQEKIDIPDKCKIEEQNKTVSKEIETEDDDNKLETKSVEAYKSVESVVDVKKQDEYLNEYISYINRTIQENNFYPKTAKNMGIEGKCTIMFTVLNNGLIENIKIVEKSDFSIFDRSALKIIGVIGSFKTFPSLLKKERIVLKIPIKYTLKGQT